MAKMITLKSGKQVPASMAGKPYTAKNGYRYQVESDGSVTRLGRAPSGGNGDKLIRRATAEDLRTLPRGKPTSAAPTKKAKPKGSKAPVPQPRNARPGSTGRTPVPANPSAADRQRMTTSGSSARPPAKPYSNNNWGLGNVNYGPNKGPNKPNPNDNFGIPASAYKTTPPKQRTAPPSNPTGADLARIRNSGSNRQKPKPATSSNPNNNFGIPQSAYKRS